mmetsp:Transcript_52756/g.140785  ORF Transcript_52756/g.140785 Transcript_52756/m.140785 type:complete len:96 (+) Transcript_52756:47-334(+)
MEGSGAAPKSAPGGRAPAASVGGARTTVARRTPGRSGAVATANSGRKASGGGGLMNFYTDDSPGLKVGPTTVLVMSLVFMAVVCSLHIMGKFRSG